jgi:hypothetical protein
MALAGACVTDGAEFLNGNRRALQNPKIIVARNSQRSDSKESRRLIFTFTSRNLYISIIRARLPPGFNLFFRRELILSALSEWGMGRRGTGRKIQRGR